MTEGFHHRSEAKWLANELAALAGELASIDNQLARLRKRRKRLAHTHKALLQVADQMGAGDLARQVPPVRTQTFGGRGALRLALLAQLRPIAPKALDTLTLTLRVAEHVGVEFASKDEMRRYSKGSVSRALRKLRAEGLVEALHNPKTAPSMVGVWRLREAGPQTLTLGDLVIAKRGRS